MSEQHLPLVDGWTCHHTEEDQSTCFYYHDESNRSTWEYKDTLDDIPQGWQILADGEGDAYYVHVETNKTVWTLAEIEEQSIGQTGGHSLNGVLNTEKEKKEPPSIITTDSTISPPIPSPHTPSTDITISLPNTASVTDDAPTTSDATTIQPLPNTASVTDDAPTTSDATTIQPVENPKNGRRKNSSGGRLRRLSEKRNRVAAAPSLKEFKSVPIQIEVVSWNVGNQQPEEKELERLVCPWRYHGNNESNEPDVIVVGTQECKYKQQKHTMDAKAMHKKIEEQKEREHVNAEHGEVDSGHSHWMNLLTMVVGSKYHIVSKEHLLEMRLVVFAKSNVFNKVVGVSHKHKATGIAHIYGNKGGLVSSIKFGGTIMTFVSCHLAAHSKHLNRRHQDVVDILKSARIGNHRLDVTAQSNHVIWLGDLNFRIDLTDSIDGKATNHMEHGEHFREVSKLVRNSEWSKLYQHDQLRRGIFDGKVLTNFHEISPPPFPPTFKVERGSRSLTDYQEKRIPSWCDRILWTSNTERSSKLIKCESFESAPYSTSSDHKPVRAYFTVKLDPQPQILIEQQETTDSSISSRSRSSSSHTKQRHRSTTTSIRELFSFHGSSGFHHSRKNSNQSANHKLVRADAPDPTAAIKATVQNQLKRTFSKDECVAIISISKLSCQYLPKMDSNGFCDPYIVIDLLPYEFSTHLRVEHYDAKTKVAHKTCNPEFDTTDIHINTCAKDVSELVSYGALAMTVYDHDVFSKDSVIGRVIVDLSKCEKVNKLQGEDKVFEAEQTVGSSEGSLRKNEVTMTFEETILCNGIRVTGQPMTLSPSTVSGTLSIHTRGGGHGSTNSFFNNQQQNQQQTSSTSDPGSPPSDTVDLHKRAEKSHSHTWDEISGNHSEGINTKTITTRHASKNFKAAATMVLATSFLKPNKDLHTHEWKEINGNKERMLPLPPSSPLLLASRSPNGSPEAKKNKIFSSASELNDINGESTTQQLRNSYSDVGTVLSRSRIASTQDSSTDEILSIVSSTKQSAPTVICGWLKKRDSRTKFGRSTFRSRWFELNRKTCILQYYTKQPAHGSDGEGGKSDPRAIINVKKYVVSDLGEFQWELTPPKNNKHKKVKISKINSKTSSDRVWRFKADDGDHKTMWMASMKLCSKSNWNNSDNNNSNTASKSNTVVRDGSLTDTTSNNHSSSSEASRTSRALRASRVRRLSSNGFKLNN